MNLGDLLTAIATAIALGSATATAIAAIAHWIRKGYGFERDLAHAKRTLDGHGQAIDRISSEVDELGDRLTRIETRSEMGNHKSF